MALRIGRTVVAEAAKPLDARCKFLTEGNRGNGEYLDYMSSVASVPSCSKSPAGLRRSPSFKYGTQFPDICRYILIPVFHVFVFDRVPRQVVHRIVNRRVGIDVCLKNHRPLVSYRSDLRSAQAKDRIEFTIGKKRAVRCGAEAFTDNANLMLG